MQRINILNSQEIRSQYDLLAGKKRIKNNKKGKDMPVPNQRQRSPRLEFQDL